MGGLFFYGISVFGMELDVWSQLTLFWRTHGRVKAIPAVRAEYLLPAHALGVLRFTDASTLRAGDMERGEDLLQVDLPSGRH